MHLKYFTISFRYPINYSRNIALSENAGNPYVFYLDADITPCFTEHQAYEWVQAEQPSPEGHKWAYITPTFTVSHKVSDVRMPRNKRELKDLVENPESGFDYIRMFSHAVVNYGTWIYSPTSYQVCCMYLVSYPASLFSQSKCFLKILYM